MTDMTWAVLTSAKTTAGAIQRWANWDKIDPEEVIAEGEDWMAMHLRTQYMLRRKESLALLTDASTIVFDTADMADFLDPYSLFLKGHGYLQYRDPDEIDAFRWPDPDDDAINEGTPSRYTIVNRTMVFDVEADDDFSFVFQYYGRPTALSDANQTNLYTERYRLIFKNALLGCAYQLQKDTQHQDFHFKLALGFIQKRKEMDDLIRRAQHHPVRVS